MSSGGKLISVDRRIYFLAVFLDHLGRLYRLPHGWRNRFLLGVSYAFYAAWKFSFLWLILFSTAVDYVAGAQIAKRVGRQRRTWLVISIVTNLGLLGFFKYYNFFASSAASTIGLAPDAFAMSIVLPLGISFYTFQSMSYTLDIYRGRLKPVAGFRDFALYVAFFPQLVAGPIVRARNFFPQLYDWRGPDEAKIQAAIWFICVGLVKKLVIADQLGVVSDGYFNNVAAQPGFLTAWTATFAFGFQVLFDFSAYSDIAVGVGKLLGFDFPRNFAIPLLASNITELWRRWHITLSRWFRDYVFVPLAGRRPGELRVATSTLITFSLIGLWHGATWNFVLFGAYNGMLLVLHRLWRRFWRKRRLFTSTAAVAKLQYAAGVSITFLSSMVGAVFFRSRTFADAKVVLGNLVSDDLGVSRFGLGHWIMLAGIAVLAILEERKQWLTNFAHASIPRRVLFYFVVLILLTFFMTGGDRVPFIYFEF